MNKDEEIDKIKQQLTEEVWEKVVLPLVQEAMEKTHLSTLEEAKESLQQSGCKVFNVSGNEIRIRDLFKELKQEGVKDV